MTRKKNQRYTRVSVYLSDSQGKRGAYIAEKLGMRKKGIPIQKNGICQTEGIGTALKHLLLTAKI